MPDINTLRDEAIARQKELAGHLREIVGKLQKVAGEIAAYDALLDPKENPKTG